RPSTRDVELRDDGASRNGNRAHRVLGPATVRLHGEDGGEQPQWEVGRVHREDSTAERDRSIVEKGEAGQPWLEVVVRRLPMRQLPATAGRDVEHEDLIRFPTVRPRPEVAECEGPSIRAHGDYVQVAIGRSSNRRLAEAA